MKPRTKLQIEVFDLSTRLPNLSVDQKEWAFKECLDHKGFATKTRVICMDCGDSFSPNLVNRKRATCRHCGTRIKVENTRNRTDHQRAYFATACIYEDYQVIRNYELIANYKKGREARVSSYETLQYWIAPKGKIEMVGLLHHTTGYCDSWGSEWAIRKNNNWNTNKYTIYPYKYLPGSKFKRQYTKMGINGNLDGLNILDAIRIIPENPKAETLLKAKQYSLLSMLKYYSGKINGNWSSIKICLRNKYKVKDATMWMDYLDLLTYFNKDLRNAKFVCPKNLKKQHDILMNRKSRIQDKERRIRREEEMCLKIERDKTAHIRYAKNKKPFIGLKFSKGKIQISFLNSIQEVKDEGEKLNHCLFVNEYHEKQTLLFSAKIDGNKTATVEVDPELLRVVQVRGNYNNPTDHDENIKAVLNKHMNVIAERAGKMNLKTAS